MRARDNPFRTECILRVRYRLKGITWAELLKRCEILHYRAALVGPCGSGKTTLLEDLEAKLRERQFGTRLLRLGEDHPGFELAFLQKLIAGLSANDILLFDGAEQMNPLAWRWFKWRTRGAGGLIITTHQPGRLPTLWECRTSMVLLAEIVTDLFGTEPLELQPHFEFLFNKHGGNLREVLRECYDLLAAGNQLQPPQSTHELPFIRPNRS